MKKLLYILMTIIAILVVDTFVLDGRVFGLAEVIPTVNKAEKKELAELPLDKLKLPNGYKISVYAENVKNARSMTLSPSGTLYVGTRQEGSVYALKDTDGDNKIDKQYTLMEGGSMPNGVAFKDGDLYVAEHSRILKFSDIESKLAAPGEPEVIYDKFPDKKHHGWKFIAFGPDDKLYVPVGAPCNICESDEEIFGSITRLDPDGTNLEIVHTGVRNTVGFTWHPETSELFFTDNGGDMMGDDLPACELNKATAAKMNFGYPYCHQGDTLDKDFGTDKDCEDYTRPLQNLGAHVAPLGCEFYNFMSQSKNALLIAEHGSWNRSKKSGYKISMVQLDDNNNSTGYSDFITGWLDEDTDEVWGRPVDLEWMPDGSLLISDDFADAIYRVSYAGV